MTGFDIAAILIGILCGNFGAVLIKPLNIGLFWNSLAGGIGAAALTYGPRQFGLDLFDTWSHDFLAAAGAGAVLMLIAGAVVAFRYRG